MQLQAVFTRPTLLQPMPKAGKTPHAEHAAVAKVIFGHGDQVLFSGRNKLFEKYNITPGKIRVEASPGITLPSKTVMLGKLLEAHEQAVKNRLLGNYSNRHYSTNLMLENGTWGVATNIENSRDVGILCGERSSITVAWNKFLGKLKVDDLQSPAQVAQANEKLKVKLMILSSGQPLGDPSAGSPCTECQSWMATEKYFTPDTIIVNLKKDASTGEMSLRARKLGELLPFWGKTQPSLTDKPIAALPVEISEKATAALHAKQLSSDQIVGMMQKAQQEYTHNPAAEFSGKNTAAAVLFSHSSEPIVGSRVDWTKRWFETADLSTAGKAYQSIARQGVSTNVQAVAYYGQDKDVPPVTSLGVLAQPTRGGPDTIIAVIEDQKLKIRTIQDYMTDIYISSFKKP